jgi:hypothetical protein
LVPLVVTLVLYKKKMLLGDSCYDSCEASAGSTDDKKGRSRRGTGHSLTPFATMLAPLADEIKSSRSRKDKIETAQHARRRRRHDVDPSRNVLCV